jgi:hypothetical protein
LQHLHNLLAKLRQVLVLVLELNYLFRNHVLQTRCQFISLFFYFGGDSEILFAAVRGLVAMPDMGSNPRRLSGARLVHDIRFAANWRRNKVNPAQ